MNKKFVKCIAIILCFLFLFSSTPLNTLAESKLEIVNQPTEIEAEIGDLIKIEITAIGDNLKYKWEYCSQSAPEWIEANTKGRYSRATEFVVNSSSYYKQYRCVITDKYNNTVVSKPVKIKQKTAELKITEQPKDAEGAIGDLVVFNVKATGVGIKYKWEYRKTTDSEWIEASTKGRYSHTTEFTVNSSSYYKQYRCVITDDNNNMVISNPVTVKKEIIDLKITEHPKDVEGSIGELAVFDVQASGINLKYKWEYRSSNDSEWIEANTKGRYSRSTEFAINSSSFYKQYRCVITDEYNNTVISNPANVIEKNKFYLQIISQPSNVYSEYDKDVSFSVDAVGKNLKYQWLKSVDNGISWVKSGDTGNQKSTLKLKSKETLYKNLYKVIVSDVYGNTVESNAVKICLPYQNTFYLNNNDYDTNYSNGYESIINCNNFLSKAIQQQKTLTFKPNVAVNSNNLYMLKFTAIAKDKNGFLDIVVNNTSTISAKYPIYTEKSNYYIPITGISSISSISISLATENQPVTISDFQIVNFKNTAVESIKTGIHLIDSNQTVFEENDAIGAKTNASTTDESYVYSVSTGTLSIYTANEECNFISSIDGLGDCYDIAILNKKALVITSRQSGVFFVDISDVYNPVIASNYASLELATGLSTNGNYAFICSRYFGTEIVDASDIYNPKFYSKIGNNEEFYDCSVYDNQLYISVWGQRKVRIYDISDLRNPTLTSTIETDGNPGGIVVENGILYVSTGYHSRNISSNATKCGFGMGNGFEIYDVRNPKNPVWLSTSKIDGRYKYSGADFWKIKVSGNYVAVANTYCGTYVYDVSNLSAPKRVNHLTVKIEEDSKNYKAYSTGAYIFNFDQNQYHQAAIQSVSMANGYIYFGDNSTGLYRIKQDGVENEYSYNDEFSGSAKKEINLSLSNEYNSKAIDLNSSVLSVKEANNLLYAATSTGIYVLDKNLNILNFLHNQVPILDLIITSDGKHLYTCEGLDGVGVYSVDKEKLVKHSVCSNIKRYNFCATSLDFIDNNENTIIVQSGFSRYSIVNLNPLDKSKATMVSSASTSGTMYYRNICKGIIDNKYSIVFDRTNITVHSENGVEREISNTISSESNGMAVYKDNVVAIYNGGYIYFDPLSETRSLKNIPTIKISGVYLEGKVIINNNIMVISNFINGNLTVIDITDIDNPILISKFNIETNIDVAIVNQNNIYVPLRNSGLLKIERL